MRLSTGTSGFRYDEWRPAFYPPEVRGDAMLRFYATQLPAVEVHNTFYRMPAASLAEGWRKQVGEDFRFAVKAPMGIANRLRLRDCEAMLAQLAAALAPLGDALGCIYYAVPAYVKADVGLLREFLAMPQPCARVAMEFAGDDWHNEATYGALRNANAAFVVVDRDEAPVHEVPDTGDWAYVRLRRADYDEEALRWWAERLAGGGRREAFAFFRHEATAAGPRFARRMLELVGPLPNAPSPRRRKRLP
ncbi:MAG: hypothetical protein RL398_2291 [Planctomycetota bacterium]